MGLTERGGGGGGGGKKLIINRYLERLKLKIYYKLYMRLLLCVPHSFSFNLSCISFIEFDVACYKGILITLLWVLASYVMCNGNGWVNDGDKECFVVFVCHQSVVRHRIPEYFSICTNHIHAIKFPFLIYTWIWKKRLAATHTHLNANGGLFENTLNEHINL